MVFGTRLTINFGLGCMPVGPLERQRKVPASLTLTTATWACWSFKPRYYRTAGQ